MTNSVENLLSFIAAHTTDNIKILLMVIAVNVVVLAVAAFGLYRLNKAVDAFDR